MARKETVARKTRKCMLRDENLYVISSLHIYIRTRKYRDKEWKKDQAETNDLQRECGEERKMMGG